MKSQNAKFGMLLLLAVGGCAQIIGLSDYEIDPALGDAGEGGQAQGEGGDTSGSSGKAGDAGAGNVGQGGEPPVQGGMPAVGGGETAGAGGVSDPLDEVVPCDSFVCCEAANGTPVGTELLEDGSFELGPVESGITPWTQYTTSEDPEVTKPPLDLELITTAFGGWQPRTGAYFAYLSGILNEESRLYSEDVTIPDDAGWLEVSGYRRFQIDVKDATNNFDYAVVNVWGYGDSVDEYLFDWGAPGFSPDGWGDSAGWVPFAASYDALPHRGEIRYVLLGGVSDDFPGPTSMASSYLFEDISFKSYKCMR